MLPATRRNILAAITLALVLVALSLARDGAASAVAPRSEAVLVAGYGALALAAAAGLLIAPRPAMPPARELLAGLAGGALAAAGVLAAWRLAGCTWVPSPTLVAPGYAVRISAAAIEEAAVRGALWWRLGAYSPLSRVAATALVFAVMHAASRPLPALAPVLLFGLLLSLLRLLPGGLAAPLTVHVAVNAAGAFFACAPL